MSCVLSILPVFKLDLLSSRSLHVRGAEVALALDNVIGSGSRMVVVSHFGLFPVKHGEEHEGRRGSLEPPLVYTWHANNYVQIRPAGRQAKTRVLH